MRVKATESIGGFKAYVLANACGIDLETVFALKAGETVEVDTNQAAALLSRGVVQEVVE